MMKILIILILMLFILFCLDVNTIFFFNVIMLILFMLMFKFKFDFGYYFIELSYGFLGIDSISYPLILLTLLILSLMLMTLTQVDKLKVFMFIIMLLILLLFFMSMNLILMYFFFELSLIPTYFLIIYWGSNPERLSASFYLMVYMLLISIPLLFYIMYMSIELGSMEINNLIMIIEFSYGWWDYIMITGAFLVKLPIYTFHIWLPKAHVEAPVYGSMILAAVLLKLGGFGLYRIFMTIKFSVDFNYLVMSVALVGSLLVSLLSMLQVDMKSLVAYSSVVHMNLMLVGLLTLTKFGLMSSLLVMVSHGICSSGLFFMVNNYYERTSSRLLILNKGMISYMPMSTLWWFLLCSSNFSFPLSLNFFGEISLLMSIVSWNYKLMFLLMIICFFSSAYSLYLFSYVQHGDSPMASLMLSLSIKEILLINFHYFPLLFVMVDLFMFY
nr:TPA_asm: NADH dehydrogenase subunit 4 [Tetraponera aethiops]